MTSETHAPAAAAPPIRARSRWSLQTRLIVAVVSLVALILVAIGFATGTILRSIMLENLDAQVTSAAERVHLSPTGTASDVLNEGRQEVGTLLILNNFSGMTGAYVGNDDTAIALTDDEVRDVLTSIGNTVDREGWGDATVEGVGDYRIRVPGGPSSVPYAVGMPTSELVSTIGQILTTVTLLTLGGLLVLAAVIAVVIQQALKPLRVVADTAARVASQPLASGDVKITERVPAAEADDSDEIGRVGAALNTLLDHVDSSLAARQRNEERMRAFVADASHELRTPLAAIRGYSELSLRSLGQATQQPRTTKAHLEAAAQQSEQGLERIQAASLRMTTLVEDLLLLARLDEGKELVYGAVDLTRIAIEAASDAQVAGADHEWVVEVGEEPVVVAGDGARLHQVVANLLTNARVHTPAGTRVTASVALDEGEAVLRIHDDGPGIDPAVADELFERFARADSSRARQTGGTGLGLSIAKAIVSAHGGTIAVDSEPGSTTFEVRLPARPADPA
ncbi:HAMP domain-containing sensor histidine kinase [Microbacterium sp. LjRoot45]|uniref:sensor histidine kinase n=1 Tax=Microbacterium sp. LjRoot45 TaxID=3342329 RepID=UPI003ECF9F98